MSQGAESIVPAVKATPPEAPEGASPSAEPGRLSRATLAAYAGPATPLALVGLPLAVYLPAVYADADGVALSLGMVSLLVGLSRFTDGLTDPVLGFISDRTRTRFGRRKPFLVLGAPLFMLGVWLLFVPPRSFSELWGVNLGYLYLFATLGLLYLGSTIKDLPYSAWGAELSRDYSERTLITSWREAFQVSGSLIAVTIPVIAGFFGYAKPIDVVFFLALAMLVLTPLTIGTAVAAVPEHPVRESRQRLKLGESLKLVMQNGPYVRLVVIFILSTIGAAMTNSLSFFFVKHVLYAGDLYSYYLMPYFVSQIAAIPLWFALSNRIGKHRATMAAIGWYAFWSCFIPLIAAAPQVWFDPFEIDIPALFSFLPDSAKANIAAQSADVRSGKFAFFLLVMCLKGASIGALTALPNAMAADVIDIDTARTGKQRAGAYFSIWTMTRKAAYAGGIVVGGWAAVLVGFDSLADPLVNPNTPSALFLLACLYSVVPALFKFAAMPLLWSYPIDAQVVADAQAAFQRRLAGDPAGA